MGNGIDNHKLRAAWAGENNTHYFNVLTGESDIQFSTSPPLFLLPF
jgi:hypothetical protein